MTVVKRAKLTYAPKGLTLRDDQFEDIHKRLDKTRSTSKTATLDREGVMRLLNDYSVLMAHVETLETGLRSPGTPKQPLARPLDGNELI